MALLSILDLVRVTQETDARGAFDNARDLAAHCRTMGLPPVDPRTSVSSRRWTRPKGAEMSIRKRLDLAVEDGELSSDVSTTDLAKFYTVVIQGLAQHGGTRKDLLRVVAVAMEPWPDRSSRPTVD
jgi:hypothetical protein